MFGTTLNQPPTLEVDLCYALISMLSGKGDTYYSMVRIFISKWHTCSHMDQDVLNHHKDIDQYVMPNVEIVLTFSY